MELGGIAVLQQLTPQSLQGDFRQTAAASQRRSGTSRWENDRHAHIGISLPAADMIVGFTKTQDDHIVDGSGRYDCTMRLADDGAKKLV
jgi:hypothetical protein